MATWLVGYTPWLTPFRARIRLDVLPPRLWLQARSHLNIALQAPSPASLEIETMPYPKSHLDASVFETISEEYTSVSTPGPHHFTPLSSSETLASLVAKDSFHAAYSLRKEMIAHHITIPHDVLYLRAALHAITQRRSAKERSDTFEAWLSLAPDRHEEWQSFHHIRQRLFRTMDHLDLTLVYRFGLVLAMKGYYSGDAATQVVSTLARYAQPSVVERYLREVEDAARDYHVKMDTAPPSDWLNGAYNLSIRTVALAGKDDAALGLISVAHSRGIQIYDFTLNIVAKHALDQSLVLDCVRAFHPSWTPQDTNAAITVKHAPIPVEQTIDVGVLAARLRGLRIALRSSRPPSPRALHSFIASYQALGRTRALTLLPALAYRHSPKSASTWAFTAMLHHRSQQEPVHLLLVFAQHFHLVGIPRRTLLSLIRGPQGQQARKERDRRWLHGTCPMNEKLWPSAYHTALVWEALVSLSPNTEKKRLYALLLSLVRQSKQAEPEPGRDGPGVRVQLPPDTYDAAHFSPFVSACARRRPARAAGVLRDMVSLGVEPSVVQWSMVARGYAQHDDPRMALRILDRLDEMALGRSDDGDGKGGGGTGERDASRTPSDALLGTHTNVLRGFVIAGDVTHAREVETRLVERLRYQAGERPATDASIALLRELEERVGSAPK